MSVGKPAARRLLVSFPIPRASFILRSSPGSSFLRLAIVAVVAIGGCGPDTGSSRVTYPPSLALDESLSKRPDLQESVRREVEWLFGRYPSELNVPAGSPLRRGGRLLASRVIDSSGMSAGSAAPAATDSMIQDSQGRAVKVTGGYSLYRRHCLHCHGGGGDGQGPTSTFLWPKPRDFARGIFKFASTTGDKPARVDLIRTVTRGLPGTAMPGFESLMTRQEMDQVVEYVIFLSLRGETERRLAEEASFDEALFREPTALHEFSNQVFLGLSSEWKPVGEGGELQRIEPGSPRVAPSTPSILRGRDLFLGKTKEALQCTSCHGPAAKGDGPSFVPLDVFNAVVFRGKSVDSLDEAMRKLWMDGCLDAWGQPHRPANLNHGVRTAYKGGNNPRDIYYRIARGISGTKMPAHIPALASEQIWDLVNFVLALPENPRLLEDPGPLVRTP